MLAVLAGLIVFALVIGRWMTTSFDDWVPLDAPAALPAGVVEDDLPDSARFVCSQPLGSGADAVASDQAQEALRIQSLSRTPCDGPRAQHRVLGVVDLVVMALAFVATLVLWRRPSARSEPSASVTPSSSVNPR